MARYPGTSSRTRLWWSAATPTSSPAAARRRRTRGSAWRGPRRRRAPRRAAWRPWSRAPQHRPAAACVNPPIWRTTCGNAGRSPGESRFFFWWGRMAYKQWITFFLKNNWITLMLFFGDVYIGESRTWRGLRATLHWLLELTSQPVMTLWSISPSMMAGIGETSICWPCRRSGGVMNSLH